MTGGDTATVGTNTSRTKPLGPEEIIDAALELSDGRGLNAWSQRDLAARLGVVPSVLYHHVGGRDRVARGVVERVITGQPAPPADLPWQEWFRQALHPARDLFRRYPGTAKWLLMHGPSFPEVLGEFDAGIHALERAGFSRPATVYAMVYNTAILTISLSDDRLEGGDDGPRDHRAMLEEFAPLAGRSHGIAAMIRELMQPLAKGSQTAESVNEAYYRMVIECMLTGVEVLHARGELP